MITPPLGIAVYYANVRNRMRSGDVIAFGGKSRFSRAIKWCTRSPISHVAILVQAVMVGRESGDGHLNMVAESSTGGVAIRRLSATLDKYDGDVWWLPLSDNTRVRMDLAKLHEFILTHEGKPYDDWQCLMQPLMENREDFSSFFCSELVGGALECGGVIGEVNASEVRPIDVCRWALYSGVWQLKGDEKLIPGFNGVG